MNKQVLLALLGLIIICLPLMAEDSSSWLMPSVERQLVLEGDDDLSGVGRIFLPAMAGADNEPFYHLYAADNQMYSSARMGQSIFALPGNYTVCYGSGDEKNMLYQEVQLYREHTTIPTIDWGTMLVRLIDENQNSLANISYELFNEEGQSYGTGFGANIELGETLIAWVLKPGRYKLVLKGLSYNTYTNFCTVRISAGELTQYTMVIDPESDNLVGAGVIDTDSFNIDKKGRLSSTIHLNANFKSDNETDWDSPKTSLTLIGQLDNRYTYDTGTIYYTMKHLMEIGTSKESDTDFKISNDDFSIKNTLIYYFWRGLGLYSRADISTHFFDNNKYYEVAKNVRLYNSHDELIKTKNDIKNLKLQDPFFPLEIKEGIGLNIRLLNKPKASLNVRAGFGLRQDINRDAFVFNETITDTLTALEYDVYSHTEDSFQEGFEFSLVGNFQLISNIRFSTNSDILFPFDKDKEPRIDSDNIVNLRLLKYLSIDYIANLSYTKGVDDYVVIKHSVFLRFTYTLY